MISIVCRYRFIYNITAHALSRARHLSMDASMTLSSMLSQAFDRQCADVTTQTLGNDVLAKINLSNRNSC